MKSVKNGIIELKEIKGGNKMTLDVNKEKMTIMGVKFDNYEDFDAVWYAVGSSMIENFAPKIEDIEQMKSYVIKKREEIKLA